MIDQQAEAATKYVERGMADTDLYNRCLRGDEEAWMQVYEFVYRITGRFRNPWLGREDMAQEIVSHLLTKGIDQVRNPAAFTGFVRVVARRFILDLLKKKRLQITSVNAVGRRGDDGRTWDPPCPQPGPAARTLGNSLLQTVQEGIASLSKKCRKVLTAYIAYKKDGKYSSYEELAAALHLKIGTLSSRITRCLEQLAQIPAIKSWLEA